MFKKSLLWRTIIFFLIFSQTKISIASILTGYFTIHSSTLFLPSYNESLLSVYQFPLSSIVTAADCAGKSLSTGLCKTAVFNMQTNLCILYQESVLIDEQLLPGSSTDFTIVNIQRSTPRLLTVNSSTTVYAIWNTTAGLDSLSSSGGTSMGRYWYANSPQDIFDGRSNTWLCSYGPCDYLLYADHCGLNTGFYFRLSSGPFVLQAFRLVSGQYRSRDPMKVTIEGSNQNQSMLTLGSSWTLIFNGSTGFDTDPGRSLPGVIKTIDNSQIPYSSYRFLFTSKHGNQPCVEIGDLELYDFSLL